MQLWSDVFIAGMFAISFTWVYFRVCSIFSYSKPDYCLVWWWHCGQIIKVNLSHFNKWHGFIFLPQCQFLPHNTAGYKWRKRMFPKQKGHNRRSEKKHISTCYWSYVSFCQSFSLFVHLYTKSVLSNVWCSTRKPRFMTWLSYWDDWQPASWWWFVQHLSPPLRWTQSALHNHHHHIYMITANSKTVVNSGIEKYEDKCFSSFKSDHDHLHIENIGTSFT